MAKSQNEKILKDKVAQSSRLEVFEPQTLRIPAGKFLMGSTPEQANRKVNNDLDQRQVDSEQPQHTVELSEYWIGKYPITNREYQAFVKDAHPKPPQAWNGDQYPAKKGDHPVVNIYWQDAVAYCQWLSEKTKKNYRLPSEAEWEKAARGEDGRVWPWGSVFGKGNANTGESGLYKPGSEDTSPVGQFSPQGDSPYGCADMTGNVWEWCADWFSESEYKNRQDGVKDPPGPQTGNLRVLRGGSFINFDKSSYCAHRYVNRPTFSSFNFGFRVVCSS